jgi:hypothetical protein
VFDRLDSERRIYDILRGARREKKIRPRLSRKSKRHATGTPGWPIKSAPARQPIHQSSLRGRPTRPPFTGTGTSGGGGNRKHRISSRFAQLRVITGDRIPSYRKQKTAKGTFGKALCQLAKWKRRRCGEGRTWETCPPRRPWARSRARSSRALGTQTLATWRAPCCGYWRVNEA